jgi:WD40 repeat protein
VAWSADGKRIVSGSADGTVRIWDAQTGQPLGQPLQGHEASVLSVAWSADGKRIVSGSDDRTVRIWEGDWPGWMRLVCERLQYHLLLNAPEKILSDEKLINVAKQAKSACDARPWLQTPPPPRQQSWWEQAVWWVAQLWR